MPTPHAQPASGGKLLVRVHVCPPAMGYFAVTQRRDHDNNPGIHRDDTTSSVTSATEETKQVAAVAAEEAHNVAGEAQDQVATWSTGPVPRRWTRP